MPKRLTWQRTAAVVAVSLSVASSLWTGSKWPTVVDSGGAMAGNPISRYGPHWLYPLIASLTFLGLLVAVLRRRMTLGTAVSVTAFAAGAAGNVAQWIFLGGVSNPIGPLPGGHGDGYASIGDACLWVGVLAMLVQLLWGMLPRLRPKPSG